MNTSETARVPTRSPPVESRPGTWSLAKGVRRTSAASPSTSAAVEPIRSARKPHTKPIAITTSGRRSTNASGRHTESFAVVSTAMAAVIARISPTRPPSRPPPAASSCENAVGIAGANSCSVASPISTAIP